MKTTRQVATALADIDAERTRMRADAAAVADRELKAVRSLAVTCRACKRSAALHRWTFIQHRSYVPPSGCTSGAYWTDDDIAFCHIACPRCRERSYLYVRRDRDVLVGAIKRVSVCQDVFDLTIVVEADPQTF